jgi:glycerol-3-phosphate dehydrogenase (NAD(P)+)
VASSEIQDFSESVSVIGSGSWGTTIASLLAAEGRPCLLWCRTPAVAEQIEHRRENPAYLPGVRLPDALEVTTDLEKAVRRSAVLLLAIPSSYMREVIHPVASSIRAGQIVLSLAKGLEPLTNKRMTTVLAEELESLAPSRIGALSGPNLAGEMALGMPAAAVIAIVDSEAATFCQKILTTKTLRLYTNDDVIGAELGGVLKNVVAIAAGAILGLGLGENTKAWLLTRGVAEMARLGSAMGARPFTFAGLTGMGDLIATCSSPRSRNRQVGERLARGETIDEIIGSMKMVAEGVKTSKAVYELSVELGVELPITEQVVEVLYNKKRLPDAVRSLVSRELTTEWWGMPPPS